MNGLLLIGFLPFCLGAVGPTLINTDCGPIQGYTTSSARIWKSVPFALPPTGTRRWQAPVDLTGQCWPGTLDATHPPPPCMQSRDFKAIIGSEDCLFMNIVAPLEEPDRGETYPVIVFIHGGDNTMGAAEDYDMSTFAEEGAIVVSIQYRLAGFGYLAISELSEASSTGTSGNYGILDCISALRFVQTHIHNFGGNPNTVSVMGQSSGGTNIVALMISPLAKGLFHRAISLSASFKIDATLNDAEELNRVFIQRSGCDSVPSSGILACLYALSAVEVMQASPLNVYPFWDSFGDTESNMMDIPKKGHIPASLVIVDGHVIPFSSWTAFRRGNEANIVDVPVIFSTMRNEMDIAPAVTPKSKIELERDLRATLGTFGPRFSGNLERTYNVAAASDFTDVYELMARDIRFFCPSLDVATHAARVMQSPVYVVLNSMKFSHPFDIIGWVDSSENGFATDRAAHMVDLVLAVNPEVANFDADDIRHGHFLRTIWIHFTKYGATHLFPLYPFSNNGKLITEITENGELRRLVNPSDAECAGWAPIMRDYACNN